MKLRVSSVGFRILSDLGARNGAPVAAIARRLGLSQAAIRDAQARMGWPQFLDFMEAIAEALGGPEALRAASIDFVESLPDYAPILEQLTPTVLSRFIIEVVDPIAYPMLETKLTVRGPLHFEIELLARRGYEWRPIFGIASAGALGGMPRYLGQPDASVEYTPTRRGARYVLRWRPLSPRGSGGTGVDPMRAALRAIGLEAMAALGALPRSVARSSSEALDHVLHDLCESLSTPAFILSPGDLVNPLNTSAVTSLTEAPALLGRLRALGERPSEGWPSSCFKTVSLPGGRLLILVEELAPRGATGDPESERLRLLEARWGLTDRQREVLEALLKGRSNKDIAQIVGCAPKTAAVHVSALLQKAGVESRTSLLSRFWKD